MLGALSATALGVRFGAGRIVIASIVGNGMAWAVIASAWHGWGVFGVGEFLLGLTMGTANANEMGYMQSITPTVCRDGRTPRGGRSTGR